jgi:hypothetical protein
MADLGHMTGDLKKFIDDEAEAGNIIDVLIAFDKVSKTKAYQQLQAMDNICPKCLDIVQTDLNITDNDSEIVRRLETGEALPDIIKDLQPECLTCTDPGHCVECNVDPHGLRKMIGAKPLDAETSIQKVYLN